MATFALKWRRPMGDENRSHFDLQNLIQFIIGILTIGTLLVACVKGIYDTQREIVDVGNSVAKADERRANDSLLLAGMMVKMLENQLTLPQAKASRERTAKLLDEVREQQLEFKKQKEAISNGNAPPPVRREE